MVKEKYILAIDGGSQSTKLTIFNLEGNIICEAGEKLRDMHLADGGIVEHPDDDLWTSLVCASQNLMKKFKGNREDIIGVGLCTIRFCRALLKEDGRLAQPVLSWMDTRVSSPYDHVNNDVSYVTTSSGYITHRLTGEFNDTSANYQGQWPIDTFTWQWSTESEVWEYHSGLTRDMLFDLKVPGEILGYITKDAAMVTGIPEGLPVIATANDKAVEALGSGVLNNNKCLISLGTYIAGMLQGDKNVLDSTNFWSNFACVPDNYLYESNGIRRGMWTISWFMDTIGNECKAYADEKNINIEDLFEEEAKKVPVGSDGLMTVLDFLAPTDAPYRKGTMIGFDGRHTRGHIYRSIMEGIAITMKNRIDDMCNELGIKIDNLTLSGGGANSRLFMQIFADVFGVRTQRNIVNAGAGLGAAICVAVALGEYNSFDEAVKNMVNVKDEYEPDLENHKKYNLMNEKVYKKIQHMTDNLYQESFKIFN